MIEDVGHGGGEAFSAAVTGALSELAPRSTDAINVFKMKGLGELSTRRAIDSDAAPIAALIQELGYECNEPSVRQRIEDLAASASDAVFVACRDGEVLGVASVHLLPMFHAGGHVARLTALVVTRRFRRSGIGTALLQAVERFAMAQECERMELTSGDDRVEAHTFYEDLGYQRVSQRFVRRLRPGQP